MKLIPRLLAYSFVLNLLGLFGHCQETIEELKKKHSQQCDDPTHKHYKKLTLGYVTPWKKIGYELIKKYSNKFDIVSPVWFELKPEKNDDEMNVKIDGANYVDTEFMKEIRNSNSNLRIMPRFHCDDFSHEDYANWFSKKTFEQFIKILLRRVKHNKFDGIVIDCNNIWLVEESYVAFAKAIPTLYDALSTQNIKLIITIFPYTDTFNVVFNQKRFEFIGKYVDYFNIMTYDYLQYNKENTGQTSLIAPLTWINKSINYYVNMNSTTKDNMLSKILMGIPFHGYALSKRDSQSGSLLDNDRFNSLLNKDQTPKLTWNAEECEHQFELKNDYIASYPTNKFIKERLDLTHLLNLGGCAIWDIGNGNEIFMDEF